MRSLRVTALCVAVAAGAYGVACARSNDSTSKGTSAAAGGAARGDSLTMRADRARIQGDSTAPVWIVEVSDFQCPYCRMWHETTYPALVREYVATGKARLAYVNLPLPSHANAWPAAEAAMCSGIQGKFWPMHDRIFSTQERWAGMSDPAPFFDSLATAAGVDAARMRSCVTAHTTKPLIQADFDRSFAAGINSTPNFIVGEHRLEGAQPIEAFRRVIDAELAKKK